MLTYGRVLDDLGFSPEHATALKFEAELDHAILNCSKRYSTKELQIMIERAQPRIHQLFNKKIAHKTVHKLYYYVGRLGIEAKATFTETHKEVVEKETRVCPLDSLAPPPRGKFASGAFARWPSATV